MAVDTAAPVGLRAPPVGLRLTAALQHGLANTPASARAHILAVAHPSADETPRKLLNRALSRSGSETNAADHLGPAASLMPALPDAEVA
jgi:hypothetical protein